MKSWLFALVILAMGWFALGSLSAPSNTRDVSQEVQPASDAEPVALPESSTVMVTLELRADGVSIVQVLPKPALPFRLPKAWDRMPFRWALEDGTGRVLARGGFDPGPICLDPSHRGDPPHVPGDHVTPHVVHANVKLPDTGAALERVVFEVRRGEAYENYAVVPASAMSVR